MTSKIQWTDETWNPSTGCTKISEGCQNCYAERMAKRLAGRYGYPKDEPFRVTFHPDKMEQPWKWKKPRRIFVCSMGDLFHDDVEWNWQYKIIEKALVLPRHTFILLTKRPLNMAKRMKDIEFHLKRNYSGNIFPLDNLWIGVTAENQQRADERIPVLLQIPAAVRFVSIETMLEEMGFIDMEDNEGFFNPLTGEWENVFLRSKGVGPSLNWVICGGESGPNARPMRPNWARELRDQCQRAGVPFFMKQMSGKTNAERQSIPADLMVREYPK